MLKFLGIVIFWVLFIGISYLSGCVASYFEYRYMLKRYNKRNPEEYQVPMPKGFINTLISYRRYKDFVQDRNISDFYVPIIENWENN